MSKLKKRLVLAAFCLALAPLTSRAAQPEILKQIPDDATSVVVIPNIGATEGQIENYAVQMGKTLPHNLLDAGLQNMGISNGFNRSGSVGLVMVKMPPPKEGQERTNPPLVILLPATDPVALLSNLQPTAPDHGISTVTLPNQTENGYVATVGKFVAAAQDKDVLAAFLAHKGALDTANPNMLKAFETNDVVVYANVSVANEIVGPQIDQWAATLRGLAMAGGQQLTKEQSAMQTAGIQMTTDGIRKLMAESESALITAKINNSGITIGMSAFLKPGTDLAKMAAGQSTAKIANLTGLPGGSFLAAGSMTWDSATANDVMQRILDEMTGNPDLAARVSQLKAQSEIQKQMVAISSGAKFVILPGADNDLKNTTASIIVDSNDPEKLQDLFLEGIKLPNESDPDVITKTTIDPSAEMIGKVQLAKCTMKVSLRAETPDNPIAPEKKQSYESMLAYQGPKGFVFYTAVTNKKMVIFFGSDLKVIASELTAVQTNSTALTIQNDIATLTPDLIPGRNYVLYLPLERWSHLVEAATQPTAPAAGGLTLGDASLPLAISGVATPESVSTEILFPRTMIVDMAEHIPALGGGALP
jgi:hypothetical protein